MGASASNSKTIYSDGSSTYGYTLSVSWSESGASSSTNKSTISASASLSGSLVGFNSNNDQYLSVYWYDNNSYSGGTRIAIISFTSAGMNQGGTRTASGSISVPHKDNGTLSGRCVAYFTNNNGGYWCPPTSDVGTDTKTCDTIPRASVPTASPNPITIDDLGNTLTVYTNRKSSTFTHTIKVQCGTWSWTSSARSVGTSVNVTIPYSVIAQFSATSKTASATVTCTTFSGTTQIGSAQTCSVTFQINPNRDHANVGTITVQDTNARTSAVTQDNSIYIANISTLVATIPLSVSGDYTQLASAVVTCGNKSQSYTLSGTSQTITFTFDKVNASSLTVKVTDKRGNSVTATKSWTLIQYQPITLTATVGRPSATGSAGVGQITGMAYGGEFGATQNSVNVEIDFKLHDDADYDSQYTETDSFALTQSGYNQYTKSYSFAYQFDYQYQYDVRFTISDLFSTAVYTAQMMQGLPIMSWDENEVDVFGNLHIHDRLNPYIFQDIMQGFDAVFAHNGQKNLLPMTAVTTTVSGVTFTVNSDGTIKANGTANGTNYIVISPRNMALSGDYIFSGCPSGGATTTYRMDIRTEGGGAEWYDTGDGVECSLNGSYYAVIRFTSGVVFNNAEFKPMLRDARIASNVYVPNNPQGTVPTISLSIPRLNQTVNCACVMLNRKAALIYSNFTANTSSNTGNLYIELTSMRNPFVPTGVFGGAMIANKYAMIMRADGNNNAWFSTLGGSAENVTGAQASGKKIVLCMVIFNTA